MNITHYKLITTVQEMGYDGDTISLQDGGTMTIVLPDNETVKNVRQQLRNEFPLKNHHVSVQGYHNKGKGVYNTLITVTTK